MSPSLPVRSLAVAEALAAAGVAGEIVVLPMIKRAAVVVASAGRSS
ncbi:hypothetical protein [Kitasatospora aureofaciens]|nr:hypothetical protein [Kitasatospora aureofaciens]